MSSFAMEEKSAYLWSLMIREPKEVTANGRNDVVSSKGGELPPT